MSENKKIIKIKKDNEGNISDVMLENGNIVPLNHAILLAKDGELDDVSVTRGKDGGEYIKADPDGAIDKNINNLPKF